MRRCRQPADDRGPGYEVREQIDSATQRKLYAVDEATYLGWLTYHAFCYICHADSGSGGEVSSPYGQGPQRVCAANLIHWFTAYNKVGDFRQAVARGKPANGMPPWDGNAVVTARVGDVFSYLRARASGHLDKPDDTPLRVLPKHKP